MKSSTTAKSNIANELKRSELIHKKEKELNTFRILLFITLILYPLFGYLNTYVLNPQIEDFSFFIQRLVFSGLIIVSLVLSFIIPSVKRNFYLIIVGFIYLGISHLMFIGAVNGFRFSHALGILMVIMGCSLVFNKLAHLKYYLLYVILAAIISAFVAPVSELATPFVILLFSTISVVLYFALSMKFKVQRLIEENHANISALIENTEDIIWSIDYRYRYIAFNKSFERICFLLTGAKPIEGKEPLAEIAQEDLSEKLKEYYRETLGGESITTEQSFSLNGNEAYYSFSFTPIKLPNKRIIGITVFGHNITKAKLAEIEIQNKNKKITQSINYAKRIQSSLFPKHAVFEQYFPESFMIFIPKDIISGDFPFLYQKGDELYVAVVDCTGHGVPGALLSVVGSLILNEIIRYENLSASELCDQLHSHVVRTLRQGESGSENERDGMDIAMCKLNIKTGNLEFAGAYRPLFILRNGSKDIEVVMGDKYSIGGVQYKNRTVFTNHETILEKDDKVFLFSDGLTDQFGGDIDSPQKLGSDRLKNILVGLRDKSMDEIKSGVEQEFHLWKGEQKLLDDVLMVGFKI